MVIIMGRRVGARSRVLIEDCAAGASVGRIGDAVLRRIVHNLIVEWAPMAEVNRDARSANGTHLPCMIDDFLSGDGQICRIIAVPPRLAP